jgi:hypothetical protein
MAIGGPSILTESSRDKFVGVGDALTDDVICNSKSYNISQNTGKPLTRWVFVFCTSSYSELIAPCIRRLLFEYSGYTLI